jgi:hypothetical protein
MSAAAEEYTVRLDWQIRILRGHRGWYLRGKVYAVPARGRRWLMLDYKTGPFPSEAEATRVLAETRAIFGETTEREVTV